MFKPQTIVAVVDDDPSMLRALENLLDAHGFVAILFPSAEEFLTRSATIQVNCLLVDIHLSGISGIELHRQLETSGSAVPVIFMTALDDEVMRAQALKASGIACLRKPFPAHQLFEAIQKIPHLKAG